MNVTAIFFGCDSLGVRLLFVHVEDWNGYASMDVGVSLCRGRIKCMHDRLVTCTEHT